LTNRNLACLVLLLTACANPSVDNSEEAAAEVREQALGGLPYHPLVFHLDLSIFAYQLYSQSLVWPFDPYYEELDSPEGGRTAFMDRVREWATETGEAQRMRGGGIDDYRGPGSLNGFPDNIEHDPIIYQYSRLHPWSSSITNAAGRWTEYLTPTEITGQIRDVFVCTRTAYAEEGVVSIEELVARRDDAAPGARDTLVVFEGGTGDKGEDGMPSSSSLMGFALFRATTGDDYDVHISFRGSRSGVASRALFEALSTGMARGNPDWITDLGYREEDAAFITMRGQVSRGMSRSVQTIFPQLFDCLDRVGGARSVAPTNIYVTGHSLGGGLAQHFVSALLMGDQQFGPGAERTGIPASLSGWPWGAVKLITFGAPRVGNEEWAELLTTEHLETQAFGSRAGYQYDTDGTGITNLEILPRLTDPGRPAAYRVLIPNDPITTGLVPGMHVGRTIYLRQPSTLEVVDAGSHEPENIRQLMLETLRDERIPPTAWAYHDMTDLNPTRDADAAGSAGEYDKLADAVRRYHTDGDIYFDLDAFDAGFVTFMELLPTP